MKAVVLLLGVSAALHATEAADQPTIRQKGLVLVARATGHAEAKVESEATPRTLKIDMPVDEGSTITTGALEESRVVLVFSNGGTMTLMSGTSVRLEFLRQEPFEGTLKVAELPVEPSPSQCRVVLLRGTVIGKSKNLLRTRGAYFKLKLLERDFDVGGSEFKASLRSGSQITVEISEGKKG